MDGLLDHADCRVQGRNRCRGQQQTKDAVRFGTRSDGRATPASLPMLRVWSTGSAKYVDFRDSGDMTASTGSRKRELPVFGLRARCFPPVGG